MTQHQPFPMKIPNGIIYYPKFSKETLVRFDKYREPPRLPQSSIFPLQIALWTCSMHNKCITINLNPPATCRNFQSSSSNRYTNHSSRQYPKMLIQSFFFKSPKLGHKCTTRIPNPTGTRRHFQDPRPSEPSHSKFTPTKHSEMI